MIASISFSLQIFLLGLLTVFFVLIMVVLFGNFIIMFTNKFFEPLQTESIKAQKEGIDPSKIAAISAAVHNLTHGKGKVKSIEKQS